MISVGDMASKRVSMESGEGSHGREQRIGEQNLSGKGKDGRLPHMLQIAVACKETARQWSPMGATAKR